MQKRILCILLIIATISVSSCGFNNSGGKVEKISKQLVSDLTSQIDLFKGKCIAVVDIFELETEKVSTHSRIYTSELINRFVKKGYTYNFKVLEREKVETIFKEFSIQLTDLTDPDKIKSMEKALSADILVYGTVSKDYDRVNLYAVDVETYNILASSSAEAAFKEKSFLSRVTEKFFKNRKTKSFEPKTDKALKKASEKRAEEKFNLSVNIKPAVKGIVKIDKKKKTVTKGNVSFYDISPGRIFLEFLSEDQRYKSISKYFDVNKNSYSINISPERLTFPEVIDNKRKQAEKKGNKIDIILNTDKEIYSKGEYLNIIFSADHDCYIYIFNVDPENDITILYPNRYEQNNFIKAGALYSIPGENEGFRLPVKKPFGKDKIYAFASKTRLDIDFNYDNYDFKFFKSNAEGVFRGVGVEKVEKAVAVKKNISTAFHEFRTIRH